MENINTLFLFESTFTEMLSVCYGGAFFSIFVHFTFFRLGAQPWNSNKRNCNVSSVRVFFCCSLGHVFHALFLFLSVSVLCEISNIDKNIGAKEMDKKLSGIYTVSTPNRLCRQVGKGHAAASKAKGTRTKCYYVRWPGANENINVRC